MSITTLKKAFFATLVAGAIAVPGFVSAQPAKPAPAKPAPAKPAPVKPAPAKPVPAKPAAVGADAGASSTSTSGDAGTSTASGDGGTSETSAATSAPTARKMNPPPPPPTPQQVAALGALKEEVDAYEKGAKDYRDTVTTIIRLHYESKKREVLSGLDREIAIEKAELRKARDIAIKRLEEFIAIYSGARSQPEATPDAMYRLAALYEERARAEDATEPVEVGLKAAIALYKRVIR